MASARPNQPKLYAERQKEWIAKNDIQVGDYVVVDRVPEKYNGEMVWCDMSWTPHKNTFVGVVCRIEHISERAGVYLKSTTGQYCNLWFPFSILRLYSQLRFPFATGETVLRRSSTDSEWVMDTFISMIVGAGHPYYCQNGYHKYCIPMQGNAGLIGTCDSPDAEEAPPARPAFAPFEKVLVRLTDKDTWVPAHFAQWDEDGCTRTTGGIVYNHCVAYAGNEHLCGTNNAPGSKKEGE